MLNDSLKQAYRKQKTNNKVFHNEKKQTQIQTQIQTQTQIKNKSNNEQSANKSSTLTTPIKTNNNSLVEQNSTANLTHSSITSKLNFENDSNNSNNTTNTTNNTNTLINNNNNTINNTPINNNNNNNNDGDQSPIFSIPNLNDGAVVVTATYSYETCNRLIAQLTCPYIINYLNTTIPGIPQSPLNRSSNGFYYYAVENSNTLIVGVGNPDKDDQVPSVYISTNQIPSNISYEFAEINQEPIAYFSIQSQNQLDWYIAVQSNRDLDDKNDKDEFWIWLGALGFECASNCTDRGECNVNTGICSCESKYENYLCSEKGGLATVWIVLLSIFGAIILVIIIGLIIYKLKKSSDYETV
eukprot:TRINITY_DN3304_c0_g1_i2.p1 TRINITY_DN3304_c0_g1~~TRINITY_DN3304_c0_g1_i2.p1  ORF type:complete len:385 (-),score=164.18 TRINITY_DN3304_c0_g1_i2:70-1134(-)